MKSAYASSTHLRQTPNLIHSKQHSSRQTLNLYRTKKNLLSGKAWIWWPHFIASFETIVLEAVIKRGRSPPPGLVKTESHQSLQRLWSFTGPVSPHKRLWRTKETMTLIFAAQEKHTDRNVFDKLEMWWKRGRAGNNYYKNGKKSCETILYLVWLCDTFFSVKIWPKKNDWNKPIRGAQTETSLISRRENCRPIVQRIVKNQCLIDNNISCGPVHSRFLSSTPKITSVRLPHLDLIKYKIFLRGRT